MWEPFENIKRLQRPDRIVVYVKQDYWIYLQNQLSDVRCDKRRISEMFFWYSLLNLVGIKRCVRATVMSMFTGKDHSTFEKWNSILVDKNLISISKVFQKGYDYSFNEYSVIQFNVNSISDKTIKIEYNLKNVYNKIDINNYSHSFSSSQLSGILFSLTNSDIITCNENRKNIYPENVYLNMYINRYWTLRGKFDFYDNFLRLVPKYNEQEHRWYHKMHNMSKDEREYFLRFEGENIVEAWDLHNAMFVYLYFHAAKKQANNIELEEYKNVVLSGHFYEDVMDFINSKNIILVLDRSYIKEQLQKYLSYETVKRISGKNQDTIQYLIDDYFKTKFPEIRNLILNSEIIKKWDGEYISYKSKNGNDCKRKRVKHVKSIHSELMKFEEQLIVIGICKRLEEDYDFHSLTVHDAIYLKASDYEKFKTIDIKEILEKEVDTLYWKTMFKYNG